MTNVEQVVAWHREPPKWAAGFKARDWDTALVLAEALDAPDPESCCVASRQTQGRYYCTRQAGHEGPCAAHPVDE